MQLDRLIAISERWTVIGLAIALIAVAFLVNSFAPANRLHIRRTVLLYFFYLSATLAHWLLASRGGPWPGRVEFLAKLLEAFTIVSLVGLFIFDALLPRLRITYASILADLAIGLAYIATAIGVASAAGWNLSSVIATSAVVSGVLAISLQATLGNILGGVALQLDGSIHVGDWVQLENGRQGRVQQIRWRHTLVETRDWATIVVPNSQLLAGSFMILGKREGQPLQFRMWVNFHVDFRYAPQEVIRVVETALQSASIPNVASTPKPNCVCLDYARDGKDSFALYAVRYFLTDLAVDDPTSSAVRARIYAALKRADIPLARPVRTIFMTRADDDTAEARVERHREERIRSLGRMDLFRGLTDDERRFLADRLIEAPFVTGELVTRQGAIAHWLYILTKGSVEIRTSIERGTSRAVARLDAPSFFGEMGLMTGEPRAADVFALTDVECYRLDKEGFERIVQERPEIAKEMSAMLARRRVELLAVREHMDAADMHRRESLEQERILGKIRDFFGLSE
jgi:small-conductance mechanosensitive channel/CRP-like cAMP-binding protein